MKQLLTIFCFALALLSSPCFAQEDEPVEGLVVEQDSTLLRPYKLDALAPAKASFYSAIVPGLGQIYNKDYWKVPIVYGAMGISLYYYIWNNDKYHEYRDAYKNNLAGRPNTGELAGIDSDRLIRGQRFHQRNRDLSMLITVAFYILNIVDANVSAHLSQFNVNENLTFKPQFQQNQIDYKHNMGFSLTYQFK
ncbi:MAG: DUF5683 domain-containing protein [Flavobacterium sp.]